MLVRNTQFKGFLCVRYRRVFKIIELEVFDDEVHIQYFNNYCKLLFKRSSEDKKTIKSLRLQMLS